MTRPIQPGDFVTVDYGYATKSYTITSIAQDGIYFQSENGLSLIDMIDNQYIIQGLTVPHTLTFQTGIETIVKSVVPIKPKSPKPNKTKVRGGREPPLPEQGDKGTILTVLFDERGNIEGPITNYKFEVERVLRNGQNLDIKLYSGNTYGQGLYDRIIRLYWVRKGGHYEIRLDTKITTKYLRNREIFPTVCFAKDNGRCYRLARGEAHI